MNIETAKQLVGFIERFGTERPLYDISTQLTLTPYIYRQAISDFINFCYKTNLVQPDCYAISDELALNRNNAAWFENLNEQQVCQCIGVIIRQDRFNDGLIYQTIKEGTMSLLLNRLKRIHAI